LFFFTAKIRWRDFCVTLCCGAAYFSINLNAFHVHPAAALTNAVPPGEQRILTQAEALLRGAFPSLNLPFRQPELELLGIVGYAGRNPGWVDKQ
jgi:hypothetical protein